MPNRIEVAAGHLPQNLVDEEIKGIMVRLKPDKNKFDQHLQMLVDDPNQPLPAPVEEEILNKFYIQPITVVQKNNGKTGYFAGVKCPYELPFRAVNKLVLGYNLPEGYTVDDAGNAYCIENFNKKYFTVLEIQNKIEVETKDQESAKIKDYLGVDIKGDLGVEVETEGERLYNSARDVYWKTTKDGSLRGESIEYVLKEPLNLETSTKAVKHLISRLEESGSVLVWSFRTSVHVHVNITELTLKELNSFLYLSHIYEDVLVNYCGNIRSGNRFCLRTKDAEDKLDQLKKFISYKRGIKLFDENNAKYSAINIVPVAKQGSVEFRTMRGTLDLDVLVPWFTVLLNIRDYASKKTMKDLAEEVRIYPKKLSKKIFGEHLNKFFYNEFLFDISESYKRLIELPHIK